MRTVRFLARALLIATSVGLLVVTFPVLETAQLGFAGYVVGSICAEEAPVGRRRAFAVAGAACLVVGLIVAAQVAGIVFRVGGRPDRWPGAVAVVDTPTVFAGLALGIWLIAWQTVGERRARQASPA